MTKKLNMYRDVGCSQEDHLPNCSHFGMTGVYLSPHAADCPGGYEEPCICNPKAREKQQNNQKNLKLALERTLANFKRLLERKPVRDASETIAEAESALKLAKDIK